MAHLRRHVPIDRLIRSNGRDRRGHNQLKRIVQRKTPPWPPETVSVDNPYGLAALWAQGDFVAKGTLILLALMSAYSWFIIFTKWWEQRRLLRQAREVEKAFWSAENIKTGVNKLTGKGNVFKGIASEAIDAAEHHDERLTQQVPLHEWIDNVLARAVGRIGNSLSTQLPFLATTGSTAPFIGLFGTVWGIYHALVNIGIAGQASIDKVAGPVGEALIMTAIGLAVAVPAVLGYNYLLGPQQDDHGARQAVLQRPRAGHRQRLARRRHGRQGHRGRVASRPAPGIPRRRTRWQSQSARARATTIARCRRSTSRRSST